MAFDFGSYSQFDDSVTIAHPTIATAADVIQLPRYTGMLWQAMGAPEAPIDTQDFEIYNRSRTARSGEVGTGGWADGSTTTSLPISQGLAQGITVGQVLQIEDEYVVVKEVTSRSASATIDVWARGAGGTTGAAHVATTPIYSRGFAGQDLDLKNVESVFEQTGKYTNYMQTFFETIDWQKRGKILKRKGLSEDQVDGILVKEAALRLAKNLSLSTIYGKKQVGSEGSSPYMSAGILDQLADTSSGARPVLSYNAAGAFTETVLQAAISAVHLEGAPTQIWMNLKNKDIFDGFNYAKTALDVVTDKSDKVAGQSLDFYEYQGVVFEAMIDNDLPNDKVLILDPSKMWKGWQVGDGLARMEEPTLSSREFRESLQGSVGFGVDGVGYDHTYIYGLTTS